MRFVDEDQGQRGQRGQSDAAPAAGRRQPAQAAGSREEWRCQREQRGIGACLQGAGSRFGKVRNSPSSSRNTTPAACTLSRVRVHAAAQTSAHASAAPAIRPACIRLGGKVRLGPGGAGPRQQSAQRARPASGGCRRGAGGRQASAGAGQQSFRQLGTHWWSGARSCGRAKFTPAPRRAWMPIFSRMDCVAVSARPRRIRPCPAFEPPPRPWRPDAGCRGCAAAGDEPAAKLQVGKREFVQVLQGAELL